MLFQFFLFICLASSSRISAAGVDYVLNPVYDDKPYRVFEYKISNTLQCEISSPLKPDLALKWTKNDIIIEGDSEKYAIKSNQLVVFKTVEDDMGRYACVVVNKTDNRHIIRAEITVIGKPTVKILQKIPQGAFIEGQKISLECAAQGNPIPQMEWRFGNTTYTPGETSTDPSKKSESRIKVVQTTDYILTLQISEAAMTDRGEYTCAAWNEASQITNKNEKIKTEVFVRVKDKLAALWPFIGICAEVVVLCAIILVYERNRMKSELEESDTDISPEQKNTPDHGKESVRQRK